MINIKIYVFTYGIGGDNKRWSWKVIHPDPVMASHSEFAQGTVPNMYLYNSDNTHYDLLVEDNSRLAVLGLISMVEEKEFQGKEFQEKKLPENQIQEKEFQENDEDNQLGGGQEREQWKTVKHGKHITIPVNSVENTQTGKESEEIVLTKQNHSELKRDGPNNIPLVQKEENVQVNLEAQMDNLKVSEICCDKCQEDFVAHADLKNHMKRQHSKQWNCNECDFQASTRAFLTNHCKLVPGHMLSKQRMGQSWVMTCYTCKEEFRSYHELMNHRKEEHPSHKKCRYFLKGECNFSAEDCWYLHENEDKDSKSSHAEKDNFMCFVCKNIFMSKHDLMQHKKKHHPSKVLCEKFKKGICQRSSDECHYIHSQPTTNQSSTGPSHSAWDQPLPSLQKKDFYQTQPAPAPDQGTLMAALNMLSQRLQALEEKMFPQ